MGEPGNTPTGGGQNPGNPNPPTPPTPPATPPTPVTPPAETPKTHTQEDLNALAAKIRQEEKEKYERKVASEKEAAERKKQEETGEFQKLYETEKVKTTELEAKLATFDTLAANANASIEAEIAKWPVSLKKGDPGPGDINKRIDWVNTYRDAAAESVAVVTPPKGEHGGGGNTPPASATAAVDRHMSRTYAGPPKAPGT